VSEQTHRALFRRPRGLSVLALLGSVATPALADTPEWVRRFEGRTEVCAIPVDGDPSAAEAPEPSALQRQRRNLDDAPVGALLPPAVRTITDRDPAAIRADAVAHPLREGWSLVRVEASVAPAKSAIDQHLTIAVDTSTSMSSASFRGLPLLLDDPPPERGAYRSVNRLTLAREVLHELVDELADQDLTVAFVAFHQENASEILPPTPASQTDALHAAVEQIREENVGEGEVFETMYTTAAKAFAACADDRLLVLTDDAPRIKGDPEDVMAGVRAMAEQGLRLHTFALATKVDLTPVAQLTVAGGGQLHPVDTVAEARAAFVEALRPTGSTLGEPSVTVRFEGPWRTPGADGPVEGQGGSHTWQLPTPLPSDWTGVRVYEARGPVTATLKATPYFATPPTPRSWTAEVGAPKSIAAASAPVRHAAAYSLAEHALRVPADRAAVQEALAELVREVGPGREAQALVEAQAR